MKIIILAYFLILPSLLWANLNVSVGAFRDYQVYQDNKPEETKDPFVPMVQVGYNLGLYRSFLFSPQIFYAFSSRESKDEYGGDYSVKTYGFLFDAIYPFFQNFGLRFGIGHVVKSISGEGGSVTVPNGSTTTTAYRPSESDSSHTGTLNLGIEYRSASGSYWPGTKSIGARLEYLMTSITRSEQRSGYLMLGIQGYF